MQALQRVAQFLVNSYGVHVVDPHTAEEVEVENSPVNKL